MLPSRGDIVSRQFQRELPVNREMGIEFQRGQAAVFNDHAPVDHAVRHVGRGAEDQRSDRVVVSFFGDGAAAEGEFHEALNIAAVWQLPIVFVRENNQYAANNAVAVVEPEAVRQEAEGFWSRAVEELSFWPCSWPVRQPGPPRRSLEQSSAEPRAVRSQPPQEKLPPPRGRVATDGKRKPP